MRVLLGLVTAALWIVTLVAVVQAFNGAPAWVPIVWGVLALILGFVTQSLGPRTPPLSWFMAKATTATEAESLISRGARVNDVFPGGNRPLHEATMWGHKSVIKVLLSHGAELDAKNEEGWTPLHIAANNDYAKIIKLLVDYGAESDARAGDGRTPLHMAAGGVHLEAARELLRSGADPQLRDDRGHTPLEALQEVRQRWETMPLSGETPAERREFMGKIAQFAWTLHYGGGTVNDS